MLAKNDCRLLQPGGREVCNVYPWPINKLELYIAHSEPSTSPRVIENAAGDTENPDDFLRSLTAKS